MTRLALLLLTLVCFGCASPYRPLRQLTIEAGDFSDAEIAAIVSAADEWCDKSGRCVDVVIGDSKRGGWIGKAAGRKKIKRCTREGLGGFTTISMVHAPRIHLCALASDSPELFRLAVAHELGHALSLRADHLDEGNTMALDTPKNKAGEVEITAEDIAYVR